LAAGIAVVCAAAPLAAAAAFSPAGRLAAAAEALGPVAVVEDTVLDEVFPKFTPAPVPAPADTAASASILQVPRKGAAVATRPSQSDPRLRPTFEQPRWVMMRSLVVPGWGQFHNKAWIKGAAIAAGEVLLITEVVQDERELTDLQRRVDEAQAANDVPGHAAAVNEYNSLLEASTARRWWLGGLIAFALIDAYIDSHFIDFDYQFDHDRAMPEGSPPSPTVKLKVGFSF